MISKLVKLKLTIIDNMTRKKFYNDTYINQTLYNLDLVRAHLVSGLLNAVVVHRRKRGWTLSPIPSSRDMYAWQWQL